MTENSYLTGLTIGKFAPLHQGHLDLIDFGLSKVSTLFIIVYDAPDKTKVPLNTRANWIRNLYPNENVIVIEGYNAPNQHEDTDEVKRIQEDYIGRVMGGVNLTHFFSSENYGDHLSKYLGTENILYDLERNKRRISSTMIRGDFHQHIENVPELILKDLGVDFSDALDGGIDNGK